MRLIRLLIALLCLAAGLVIGALNHQPVVIDLGFSTLHATLGVSVLVALLLGAVIGGLVLTASVVLPLRQRLRRARSAVAASPAPGDGY
ncbi:MAG TPA: LapA family protein [Luteimonas sp.]|nr:LapA family protein [Luteimonas sp.]